MNRYLLISKTEKYAPALDDWYVAEHDTLSKTLAEIEDLLRGEYWNPHDIDKSVDRLQHLNVTGQLIIEHPKYSSNTWRETLTIIKL